MLAWPIERLFPRTYLNDPVASDSLFGLSERYFCNRCLAVHVGNKCSGRRGEEPIEPEQQPAFCSLLHSIILATASAPGAASAAAVSYPLRITTIMKRIHISFIIDSRQHWLAH